MDWRFAYADQRKRVALLASRDEHCLLDLLWRWRRGELDGDVVAVVSRTIPTTRDDVAGFGVPFHHVPVAREPSRRRGADARAARRATSTSSCSRATCRSCRGDFLERLGAPVINIHHSFLPAFVGADPYRRARERGVKIIGATAHYVTEELDAGPIIEQDVARVSHRETSRSSSGSAATSSASCSPARSQWHLEDRILVHENRTVVF